MICKLTLILGAVALATAVTYEEQQQQPQQQRLQAGPLQPQYRYVQPQQQPAPVQYQQPQYQQPQYQQPAAVYQQALPQQAVYRQQPQALPQRPRKLRPVAGQQLLAPAAAEGADDPDYDPNPAPYQFSFDVHDDLNTNYQNRKEQREGDKITGSYSVVDSDGFIRTVKYTADPLEGFKAEVSREPTDIKVLVPTPAPAAPLTHRQQQTQQYLEAAPQYQAPQAQVYSSLSQPQQYVRRPAAARAPAPARQQYEAAPQQQYHVASAAQPIQYVAPQVAQRAKPAAYLTAQQAAQYQGYAPQ